MVDTKKSNILMDDSLRLMRIRGQPIHRDENLLVIDWLERGFLRLYEYMGGSIYISNDTSEMDGYSNVAMIAELIVSLRVERKEVKIERIFNEYGYNYEDLLKQQLMHFASYYGFSLGLLDLRKTKCESRIMESCPEFRKKKVEMEVI